MAVAPVSSSASNSASAFGLNFQSLLQIILQQLTYQDPLKPLDNFEFVSQLAQFSQLQQSQTLNNSVAGLLAAQTTIQAAGMLGKTIDFTTAGGSSSSNSTSSGVVQTVALSGGTPTVTVLTSAGATVSNISMSQITQIGQ